jgi:hypothetical protein
LGISCTKSTLKKANYEKAIRNIGFGRCGFLRLQPIQKVKKKQKRKIELKWHKK